MYIAMSTDEREGNTMKTNRKAIWETGIDDAMERNYDCIEYSEMTSDEFKNECIETVAYYYEHNGNRFSGNYDDIVSDTAKIYGMWRE